MRALKIKHRFAAALQNLDRTDRKAAVLEQALLAGIRMAGFLVFARIMSTENFGVFALVVSASFAISSFQRAVVILPFIVACQSAEDVDKAILEWWWIAVAGAVATTLIFLLAWVGTMVMGVPEWIQVMLFYSAGGASSLMLYTFFRRVCYQTGEVRYIVKMALAYALVYAIGIAIAIFVRDVESLPFWAFIAAPVAGGLVGLVHLRKRLGRPPAGALHSFRSSQKFAKWAFLSGLVGSVYSNGMNIIVASFLGPVSSAMYSATRTIVAPIITLTAATDMIDKPQAGRAYAADGVRGLRRSVRSTLALLIFFGGLYLLFVGIFAGPILEILYGPKYAGLELELRVWTLAMLLFMVTNPLSTHLITLKDTRTMFLCNLPGAIIALAVAIALFEPLGVVAALLGLSGGRLVNVVLLYLATRRDDTATLSPARPGDTKVSYLASDLD